MHFLVWRDQLADVFEVADDVASIDHLLHHLAGQMTLPVDQERRHAKATRGKVIVLDLVADVAHVRRAQRAELVKGLVKDGRLRLGGTRVLRRHREVEVLVEAVSTEGRRQRSIEVRHDAEPQAATLQTVETLADIRKHLVGTCSMVLHMHSIHHLQPLLAVLPSVFWTLLVG